MPPKRENKPDDSAVGVYDVEIMNEDELKQYIEALKEESERMKTSFIDHQRDKIELEDLLKNTQEDILNRYEILMQKELELQQLLSESHDILKDEYTTQLIKSLETNKKLAQSMIDNFIEVQEARTVQQDEWGKMQTNLNVREREVNNIKLAHKFISIDLNQQTEEDSNNVIEKRQTTLEDISEEFKEKHLEERWKFVEEEERLMKDILDSFFGEDPDKYPSTDEAEKMSWYFKDIFWKNTKASANLKVKVESLEKELNKLQILLKEAEDENKKLLKSAEENTYSSQNDELAVSEKDYFDDKQLDYLNYENYTLHEKLRQVIEERDILKNKFISAMRNIHEKADFASFLAEQMMVSFSEKQQLPDKIPLKENVQETVSEESSFNEDYEETAIDTKS